MNPEIKTEWVRRLRSGDYIQGEGYLALRPSFGETWQYCCLGVLCEIAVEAGVVQRGGTVEVGRGEVLRYATDTDSVGEISLLPEAVWEWAGLDSEEPSVVIQESRTSLIVMNDTLHKPFTTIADAIEEGL